MKCEACGKQFDKKRPYHVGRFCALACYFRYRKKQKESLIASGVDTKKRWYEKHRDRLLARGKLYAYEHRDEIKAYKQEWARRRKDPNWTSRRPPRINTQCYVCGKPLSLQPNQVRKSNCCSIECRNKSYALRFGDKAARWKGGRIKVAGYVAVRLTPNDYFLPMKGTRGYVLEHRKVMAQHLGRLLERWEVVHHKNGVKDDNRIENLELLPGRGEHNTMMNKEIKRLQSENAKLRKVIAELTAVAEAKT